MINNKTMCKYCELRKQVDISCSRSQRLIQSILKYSENKLCPGTCKTLKLIDDEIKKMILKSKSLNEVDK